MSVAPDLLPPLREGRSAPDDLLARRAGLAAATAPHEGVSCSKIVLDDVPAVLCEPSSARGTMLHFHGGSFRMGGAARWTAYVSAIAAAANVRAVIVDYPLAPENPFPAAIVTGVRAYRAAASRWNEPVIVTGDSAGGNLAMGVVLARLRAGQAMPAGVSVLSPWLDLSVSGDTFSLCAESDKLFSRASALEASEQYLQGYPANDPLASPLFAELKGFPACQILASGSEVLLSDTLRFCERLALAGSSVEMKISPELPHAWASLFPDLPATGTAISDIAAFIAKRIGSESA